LEPKVVVDGVNCEVKAGIAMMVMGGYVIEFAYLRPSELIDVSERLSLLIDEFEDDVR